MDLLKHYVRLHLTAMSAGIDLFGRSEGIEDEEARKLATDVRHQLVEQREALRLVARRIGASEPRLPALAARAGERLGRLKPNGSLVHRTPLTDVVDLEAMHDVACGLVAGWSALQEVDDPRVDRDKVRRLLAQGQDQVERLRDVHRTAARRAFA
ncbi:hypothetical protein ASD11_09785 [Aeromicrobium sp. Root495]|uniref:hypothetical protein n=1 Tax=Aeromicrobium sp. Root495 TaxID=1736550 RepID=UPI0006F498CC|nr:hypothetical protein [Aeromicrobium sp. Root495]KQY59808.1 hypothetical protein ASD11_09785 [Aeromicrobium sp. Root495]